MSDALPAVSQGWIVAMAATIAIQIILPLALGLLVRRWLGVGWRFFAYGMLIFFVFQMATRVPAVQIVQTALGPRLGTTSPLYWGWVISLALTAGLFEEVGRWVGYRWLFRPAERTWGGAVMYGLGHGGLESMLLVAGLSAVNLAGLLALGATELAQLPPEQRDTVVGQLAALAAQPGWFPLLGAWERAWAIAVHVGLSVLVLQVFHLRSYAWLVLAIAFHTLVNFASVGLLTLLGPGRVSAAVATEVLLAVLGGAALWAAWRLRDRPLVGAARGV